jgi:hypothetical protein
MQIRGAMKKKNEVAAAAASRMPDTPVSLARRTFLWNTAKITGGIVCMEALGGLIGCGNGGDEGTSRAETTPYDRKVLLDGFEEQLPLYKSALSKKKNSTATALAADIARGYFENLMPAIPYVGDPQYELPKTLIQSAVALSFYRSLHVSGENFGQVGTLIVDAAEIGYSAVSEMDHRAQGDFQITEEWYQLQRYVAKKSQERHYPGDWVFHFVEGVKGEFDWGWDFTECGILKFYQAQQVKELIPHLCVLDFIVSKREGTGLQRTKTLAQGDDCCDFRYMKGREVVIPI